MPGIRVDSYPQPRAARTGHQDTPLATSVTLAANPKPRIVWDTCARVEVAVNSAWKRIWQDDCALDLPECALAFAVIFALYLGLRAVGFSGQQAFSAAGDQLGSLAQ
jgi:hypothetical protein